MRIKVAPRSKTFSNTHPLYPRGFTIVELLIVVVIIAILATVTVVAYNGMVARARAGQASAALNQAKKKLEIYKVDNNVYPATGNLASAGVSDGDTAYQYTSDGTAYCLTATAANVSYYLNSTTQASPAQGGCPGHGQGGVVAITNLITNPSFETGTTSWLSANGATLTWQASSAIGFGAYGVRVVPGANTSDSGIGYNLSAAAGKTYTFSASVRAIVAGTYIMSSQGAAGAGWANNSMRAMSAGEVYRFSLTWTAAASGNAALFILRPGTSGPAQNSFDVDGMMVVEGANVNYADGSSLNWIWNGTANASTSTGPAL